MVKDGEAWRAAVHGVAESGTTKSLDVKKSEIQFWFCHLAAWLCELEQVTYPFGSLF